MRFRHLLRPAAVHACLLVGVAPVLLVPHGRVHAQALTQTTPNRSDGAVAPPAATAGADFYEQVADARGLGGVVGYGRGAAFADVDGDGDDDLFVADTDGRFNGPSYGVSLLYLNDGTGHFEPARLGLEPADLHGTWVGSFADYDNDGDPDLLVGNGGYTMRSSLALLENRIDLDEGFVNVTQPSGLWGQNAAAGPSAWWGISWADYDNDGWLDVVVTRRAERPLLFHHERDGTFSERGDLAGISVTGNRDTKNPVWIDYDEDGDQDLYVAGMDWHAFYRNDGGVFEDVTRLIFAEPLEARGSQPVVFAAATADFDQDGHEDLYLGRWDAQDYVMFGDGAGHFERLGAEAGLDTRTHPKMSAADTLAFSPELRAARTTARAMDLEGAPGELPSYENTMGLGVGDLFDDGFPDVVIGTGDPSFNAADVIFCNRGDRRFERCIDRFVEPDGSHRMTRGHGAAFADVDRDGFTDFFFNLGGHPNFDHAQGTDSREVNKLFVRRTDEVANAAWLRLRGTDSNRDAIGARIRYGEGDLTRYQYVRSTMGFQAQNSATLLLPLGGRESASVIVDWPSGASTELTVRAGELTTVAEGATEPSW